MAAGADKAARLEGALHFKTSKFTNKQAARKDDRITEARRYVRGADESRDESLLGTPFASAKGLAWPVRSPGPTTHRVP